MRPLILLSIAVSAALAQPVSFGIKAGAPLTDFINTVQTGNYKSTADNNRYIIGPTLELRLPFGLGIEADALYRHFNYQSTSSLVDVVTTVAASSNEWEFPILAKYRFPSKIVRPYLDAGVAFDSLQGLKATVTTTFAPSRTTTTSTSAPPELTKNTTLGAVLGVGVDIHALVIHISPEIRYTRWTNQHFNASNLLQSNQNQAEFLVGITF